MEEAQAEAELYEESRKVFDDEAVVRVVHNNGVPTLLAVGSRMLAGEIA